MPFYDRSIDLVVLTHPQKDHLHGIVEVLKRYQVKQFVTVPVSHTIDEYADLQKILKEKQIPIRYVTRGDQFVLGEIKITTLWPEKNWLLGTLGQSLDPEIFSKVSKGSLTGIQSSLDLNTFSLYLLMQFHTVDILFTGDGDQSVQKEMVTRAISFPADIEVLKVPHHGSKTGMIDEFIKTMRPKISVIEVGKNNYGHPSSAVVKALSLYGKVMRTDTSGNIELVIDTNSLTTIKTTKK